MSWGERRSTGAASFDCAGDSRDAAAHALGWLHALHLPFSQACSLLTQIPVSSLWNNELDAVGLFFEMSVKPSNQGWALRGWASLGKS